MSSIPAGKTTLIIRFVVPLYRYLEPYAYTLIRVAAGAIFIRTAAEVFLDGAAIAASIPWSTRSGLSTRRGRAPHARHLYAPDRAAPAAGRRRDHLRQPRQGLAVDARGVQYHAFIFGMLLAVLIGGAGRDALGRSWRP